MMAQTGGNSVRPFNNLSRRESGIWDSSSDCRVDGTWLFAVQLECEDNRTVNWTGFTSASQSSFLSFWTSGKSAAEVSPGIRLSSSSNFSITDKLKCSNYVDSYDHVGDLRLTKWCVCVCVCVSGVFNLYFIFHHLSEYIFINFRQGMWLYVTMITSSHTEC